MSPRARRPPLPGERFRGSVTARALAAVTLLAGGLAAARAGCAEPPDPGARLAALLEEEWAYRLREDPLLATDVGVHRYDDRLPSMAPEDVGRRARYYRELAHRLAAVDTVALDEQERISRAMLLRFARDRVAAHDFGRHLMPLTADAGFHIELARLPESVPLGTTAAYEAYLSRLRQVRRYVDEHIALLREGLRRGLTVPRVVLEGYDRTIEGHVVGDADASVFFAPFEDFPAGVPEGERGRLREAGRRAVADGVVPAYARFLSFMQEEYRPGARTSPGAAALPRGRAYYAWLVRHYTTLDRTPEEIHELGLREMARIRAEMDAAIRETGFQGSFAEFLEFLRTDDRFYPETPGELLREAAWIAKRMDGRLPELFGRLPRLPYGIRSVPEELAPQFTGGRYIAAPVGSARAGSYWVNTYDLASRPLYVMEALTLHEAVPGHHLQIALAREREDLPPQRRFASVTAFSEGWALYAERLGLEAGFYTDPYRDFGRLTYEMWRACRLVVDTGIHAMGWSRERAMEYLASRTALSRHEVTTETDRYISWPGQALAYKTGELAIRELRAEAEERLGPAFDVRAFHDAVLRDGVVPLEVLRARMRAWIEGRAAGSGPGTPSERPRSGPGAGDPPPGPLL